MVITALIIPADPESAPVLAPIEPSLARAQRLVGGYIEGLPSGEDWFAYGNEEAKIEGLPFNTRAHGLLRDLAGHNPADVLRGTVFIVGRDDEGEWQSIPEAAVAEFREWGLFPEVGLAP
jgi:hypothetical protein